MLQVFNFLIINIAYKLVLVSEELSVFKKNVATKE